MSTPKIEEEEDGIYDLLIRWRLHRARASINEIDIFYCRATEGKAVFGSVSHYKLKLHGFSIIILLFTTFSALLCMIIVFRGHGFSARSVSNTRVPTS